MKVPNNNSKIQPNSVEILNLAFEFYETGKSSHRHLGLGMEKVAERPEHPCQVMINRSTVGHPLFTVGEGCGGGLLAGIHAD